MTLRAALIGCGKIGSGFADDPLLLGDVFTHAEAYVRSTSTELVAVSDSDRTTAEACAARWGLTSSYTDVEQMLRDVAPDVVSICTPDETHFHIAQLALEAPSVRAVMCEKPLATNLADAEQLVRLAKERGKLLAVPYFRRFAGNFQQLRELLRQSKLGEIRAISGWYTKGVLHNGTHWFDLLRMLSGEAVWVEACNRLDEVCTDPTLDVTVGLTAGTVATLRGLDSRYYTIFEMDVLTDAGRVSVTDSGHTMRLFRAEPSGRYSGYSELAGEQHEFEHMRDVMLRAVDDLAEAVVSQRQPLCSGEDGVAALRIGVAAIRAAAAGRRVDINASEER